MTDWTDEQIDAATRVFCAGLPLETHPEANSLAGRIAKGRCLAPKCKCWEGGRTVTRAALEAASAVPMAAPDEIVKLRNALHEVTTNGEWTEGEQCGDWKISKEVYETARDALAPAATGKTT